MTITLEAATLAAALKHAASVVETRNTIPILANVLLRARGNSLELVTTDLDCELRQNLAVSCDGDLATTVDAQRLSAIAGALEKGAQISLALEDKRLTVKSGRSRFQLPTLPVDDFPSLPPPGGDVSIEMSGKSLASALHRVAPTISTEVTRYYLCGAFLNAEAGKLRVTSTNGNCCTSIDCEAEWPASAPEVIMPSKAVRLIQQLFEGADAVSLAWDNRKIVASAGNSVFTTKTIDGSFPDYRRIVPAALAEPIRLDPDQVRAAVRRIQLVSTGKTRAVRIETKTDCLVISSNDPEGGTACEEVPAECVAGHLTGFNASYLSQMLEVVGGDTVELHHADAGAPCLMRRTIGGDAIGVVMPMRV